MLLIEHTGGCCGAVGVIIIPVVGILLLYIRKTGKIPLLTTVLMYLRRKM